MLTPSDIRNRRFEKGMGGYKVDEVHNFLNEVADQFESLIEEKEDLNHKLEILAEKLEQYREDEESLRAALIGAQKLGDSVIRDSKRKAEAIIAQATRKAEEIAQEARASIDKEAMALNRMQLEVARFKEQILTMYKQHIELIQAIPEAELPAEVKDKPFVASIGETVEVKASDTEKAEEEPQLSFVPVQGDRSEGEQEATLAFEPVAAESETTGDAQEEDFPRRKPKSKFGILRFGEAYDLTRKE